MTLARAQAAAVDLRTALLDHGVPRVSIELQQGVAGSGWGVAPFKRVLSHHIASYPPGTPGLGVVKSGRGGKLPLSGPLANCYGGFDLTARILTLGWANHPGTGGPWPVPGWGTVPRDNGRPYILGWEFEGGYLPYTDEMHEFMARCGAGSLDWLGTLPGNPGPAPLECHDEHKGWAGPRKGDRVGYSTASGRARIAAVRGTPTTITTEDDMFSDEDRKLLLNVSEKMGGVGLGWWLDADDARGGPNSKGELTKRIRDTHEAAVQTLVLAARNADVDEVALARELSAQLTPILSGEVASAVVESLADELALTPERVAVATERAVEAALARVGSALLHPTPLNARPA